MSDPVVVPQEPVASVDDVGRRLDDAFVAVQAAVAAGRPVAVVLDDADLLGQGTPEDAALAGALLGMARAVAIEGVKPSWQVNAVSHRHDTDALSETVTWVSRPGGPTGQLIRLSTAHVGRVQP